MIGKMFFATILATATLLGSASQNDAVACSKTGGCAMDVIHEDYNMRRDGRADKAMRAGQDNIEAFRAFQAKQKAYSAGK
ncbi:hypothetical protein ASE61_19540 [Bosea sp. Root670]|uniref:hypothetical protein n=1 Tax=Bosea sp. Root670 TaxID=1736583 RepID=UPI0007136FBD|nr:hypothetical protein [Bosea sp. Root670]KRE00665.1 hypothetical protein ASE61_19540 [Bosea sp. Root670]